MACMQGSGLVVTFFSRQKRHATGARLLRTGMAAISPPLIIHGRQRELSEHEILELEDHREIASFQLCRSPWGREISGGEKCGRLN